MTKKDLIDSFEDLTPSDYQKDKMLNNVLSTGMNKNTHKICFSFRHLFSTAVAAACVLAVVVTVVPMYESQKSVSDVTDITSVINEDKPIESSVGLSTDDNVQNAEIATSDEAEINKAEKEYSSAANNEASAVENTTERESPPSENDESILNSRARMLEQSIQLNINNGFPLSYDAAAYLSSAEEESEIMTLRDYYIYLGVNVGDVVAIPEGYTDSTDDICEINKTNSDKWLFSYTKNTGYIYITTTKHTDSAERYINSGYSISDIKGIPAVVFEESGSYMAYVVSEGIAFTINTSEVSEAELINLLQSIVR